MKSLIIRTPAKINLFLEVLKKRQDNYHDIDTIFQKVSLYDIVRVSVSEKPGIRVQCRHISVPSGKRNIAYKAAKLMVDEFGITNGININIDKNIPVAAGLGGGSSDAAAVMAGISKIFGIEAAKERLVSLAKSIGADVPFFMSGLSCASGRGIGERLREIKNRQNRYVVLVMPDLMIYTKTIYKQISLFLTRPRRSATMLAHTLSGNSRHLRIGCLLYNRLEDVVLAEYSIVRQAKEALSLYDCDGVLLSGSGPAVFGLFRKREEAMRAKKALSKLKGLKVCLVRFI